MAEFTLDTSGKAYRSISETSLEAVYWTDLDLFTQGYAAKALESVGAAFHQLAPETLAAILKDCARFQALHENAQDGGRFYRARQKGLFTNEAFPPLTSSLDGSKVYLKEAAPHA